jgi:hypothetical protein
MIVKSVPSSTFLSLNMGNVNALFPGFQAGDFALIHGSNAVHSLVTLLSVRAQLPTQLGGLASNVVYIDGNNTFRLYQTTRLAKLCQLDPIYISRAFTAYQMTALTMQKLDEGTKTCNAKLVIISDIAAMFLDSDLQQEEAERIYSHVTTRLSNFARESQTIIIATYPPHYGSPRNKYLKAITSARANVVLALRQTEYKREVILEKHPIFACGSAELPDKNFQLTAFMDA